MVAKRHELETKSIDTRQRKTSYIVSMDSLKTREFLEPELRVTYSLFELIELK